MIFFSKFLFFRINEKNKKKSLVSVFRKKYGSKKIYSKKAWKWEELKKSFVIRTNYRKERERKEK